MEVHHAPEQALSDGPQAITPNEFDDLVASLRAMAGSLKREIC